MKYLCRVGDRLTCSYTGCGSHNISLLLRRMVSDVQLFTRKIFKYLVNSNEKTAATIAIYSHIRLDVSNYGHRS